MEISQGFPVNDNRVMGTGWWSLCVIISRPRQTNVKEAWPKPFLLVLHSLSLSFSNINTRTPYKRKNLSCQLLDDILCTLFSEAPFVFQKPCIMNVRVFIFSVCRSSFVCRSLITILFRSQKMSGLQGNAAQLKSGLTTARDVFTVWYLHRWNEYCVASLM